MSKYLNILEAYTIKSNWFNDNDITNNNIKEVNGLLGYVLPHAGTAHTGNILSHTLRFINPTWLTKEVLNIFIAYYPSSRQPNIQEQYYHELFVVKEALNTYWNRRNINLNIISWNVRDEYIPTFSNIDMYVISADFSHYLQLQSALKYENHAAKAIELNLLNDKSMSIVDDKITFQEMSKINPDIIYNWIGRSRSKGIKGVGYLSFLLLDKKEIMNSISNLNNFSGFFVTGYDDELYSRECLGSFNNITVDSIKDMIKDVKTKGETYSRLIPSRAGIEVTHFTITFLKRTQDTEFIRGYHGIKKGSYYLRTVMLENTYENGKWIRRDDLDWINLDNKTSYDMTETINQLINKFQYYSGNTNLIKDLNIELYSEITIPSTLFNKF